MTPAGLGAILRTVCAGDKFSDKRKNTSNRATRFQVMSYADVACCSVLIWLFGYPTVLSCTLSIGGIAGEGIADD